MSDIIVLRLVSGENILADVDTEHSATHVLAKHPTMIQAGPNPQTGQVDVHMAPLLTLSEDKQVAIRKDLIAFQYKPVPEIRNKFSTLFGSGIIVPENPNQILKA